MEEDSAECGGDGCLFLFPAESLSARQCPTSGGALSKLNATDSVSRCCGPERRQAHSSQNNCRRVGNAGRCAGTTVVDWAVHTRSHRLQDHSASTVRNAFRHAFETGIWYNAVVEG